MDKSKLTALLAIIIALFAGCGLVADTPAPLPAPSVQDLTISYDPASDIVILSYPDAELESMNRVTYETIHEGNSLAYTAVYSLLAGKNAEENYIPFTKSASIQTFFVSRNVAILDIRADLSLMTEREYFCSVISLVNTLTEIEGIEYVKLKINGDDLKPIGIYTNPMIHNSSDLHVLYLQHLDLLINNNLTQTASSTEYLLYFTDLSGKYMLAEVRSGSMSGQNNAEDLINQLKNGPAASDEMKSIIPKSVVLQNEPTVYSDGEFGNILTISLEAPKYETMDSQARYMMAATIVATMQSNIAEIDAVRVFINSQPAISTSIMKQETFYDKIGNIATLYFPNEDFSYLIPIKRAFSQRDYSSRSKRLEQLIEGVLDYESDSAQNIFPSEMDMDDLLSLKVSDNVAYVNFSPDIVLSCDYSIAQETMLIYSIVNTLSEFKDVKRVQILVDGQIQATLCGHLSAEEPFLPNPGIIQ